MKRLQQPPTTLDAIGKTPIVQLQKIVPEGSADILVKLEYFNPTGSYKDRMALAMIEEAEKRGKLEYLLEIFHRFGFYRWAPSVPTNVGIFRGDTQVFHS